MGAEHVYSAIRVTIIVIYTVATLLLTRSLIIAFVADYGWPWRRRPGANGRSALDLRVILFTAGLSVLGLFTCGATARRLLLAGPYQIGLESLLMTAFIAYMAAGAVDLWVRARRERLKYGKGRHA